MPLPGCSSQPVGHVPLGPLLFPSLLSDRLDELLDFVIVAADVVVRAHELYGP